MPQISVIVPVYKVEQFLPRCIDSILNQSFTDFELILVEDGSPDNCGTICDRYAGQDGRIRVIHRENGGLSAARNSGMDWVYTNSDSQWITFVDSDDWIHPDYLMLLHRGAIEQQCLISACQYFESSGDSFPIQTDTKAECLSADDYYCGEEYRESPIACAKLYHVSLLREVRYPVGKLHEDEFTTFRVIYAAGKIAVLKRPMYAYYQNPEGIIRSKWNPRRLHIVEAFEVQIAYAAEHKLERFYRKAVKDYIYGIHEQLCASEPDYHSQLRKKYRTALRLGRECAVFPLCWAYLWAYEEAYPVKLFWWCLFKGRHLLDRLLGKDKP